MTKRFAPLFATLLFPVVALFAQDYKLEPIATPPPDLPAAYASVISASGFRISGPAGVKCEVWFSKSIKSGAAPDQTMVFGIAQGTLLGVIRFPGKGEDRRGQQLSPGLYTLRYSDFPNDGAHQGVAPQRDFALMSPIAADTDPSSHPAFDALIQLSNKASNSPHPAVLSLETPTAATLPSLTKEGENPDWVLGVQIADVKLALIVIGKTQG